MSTSGIRMERVPSEKIENPLTASASGASNDAFGPRHPVTRLGARWCQAHAGWQLTLTLRVREPNRSLDVRNRRPLG
jgi:hypothetical protein